LVRQLPGSFAPLANPRDNFAFAKSPDRQTLDGEMNPYAKPNERKVGAKRPKISHLPQTIDNRTRSERKAEKEAVAAARRAIKKAARQHLKKDLLSEIEKE
jgi:hypothetical protein